MLMVNLLIILSALAVVLALVVYLTSRFAKPMDAERQRMLSRVAMVLIMLLLMGRLLQQWIGGQ
ncbi:hypothetical protein GP2143_09570 [marine gamma proteobacterium HTCC2143]|jgi:cation transport ATPase|uniref:Uncharacterized protein n=1 Tax=marine gamma proteobacterium HTCC2143 TaxID=247633 RepID=A0YFN0_9GAMM|nr:hypothetical protein GP2143_09570 [marine gamma proteobacterium HTCC2143]